MFWGYCVCRELFVGVIVILCFSLMICDLVFCGVVVVICCDRIVYFCWLDVRILFLILMFVCFGFWESIFGIGLFGVFFFFVLVLMVGVWIFCFGECRLGG